MMPAGPLRGGRWAGPPAVLFVVVASLAIVQLLVAGQELGAEPQEVDEGSAKREAEKHSLNEFYHFMRPRLGYFAKFAPTEPYFDLFEVYFQSVVKNNDAAMRSIDVNDWRQRRPSAKFCIELLIGFQVEDYTLNKPYDLIPLDACLEWLFDESDEKQLDFKYLNKRLISEAKSLKNEPKFRQLHESTGFREPQEVQRRWPKRLLADVHAYLTKLLAINKDNPTSGCHSLWLEAYNDFIEEVYVGDECEDEDASGCKFFGLENSERDSYLGMILESTKRSARICYGVMQTQMRDLIVKEYESSKWKPATFKKKFITKTNRVQKQCEREKWSREMLGILQIASGIDSDQPINLGETVLALDRIKSSDYDTVKRFTDALAEYAQNNADLKNSGNDPQGSARYGRAMTKLCRPYIDPARFLPKSGEDQLDEEDDEAEARPFEFYNLIYALVRATNHESILGITKNQFEDDVVANKWEPLYLATFACQIISTTWGTLTNDQNSLTKDQSELKFLVKLRQAARIQIEDWPIEVMTVKLPLLYPRQEVASGFSLAGMKSPKLMESLHTKQLQFKQATGATAGDHQPRNKVRNFRKRFGSLFARNPDQQQHVSTSDFADRLPPAERAQVHSPAEAAYDFGQPDATVRAAPKPVYRAPASAATPAAATTASSGANSGPAAKPGPPKGVLPLRSILYFRDLHGHFPMLPDNIHEVYPELPRDLSGTYPKLSVEELKAKYPLQEGWRVAQVPFEEHEKEALLQQRQQEQQQQEAAAAAAAAATAAAAPAPSRAGRWDAGEPAAKRPVTGFIKPRGSSVSERVARFEQPHQPNPSGREQSDGRPTSSSAAAPATASQADRWGKLNKMKI